MTNAVSLAQQASTGVSQGFKNRIINGAMVIDQRNAGASVTPANADYTVDRWQYEATQASKFTVQQNQGSVTPPAGFINYLGLTVASSVSVGSSDYFLIEQSIEGYNIADLNFGSANAKTVTLSFWVRSSLTGTFSGALASSGFNRAYIFTYSISAANTWEYKTITIVGCPDGNWLTNNGNGMHVRFALGTGSTYSSSTINTWGSSVVWNQTGSVNLVGTNGATFYITGVQLEVGSTATSFDYRPYGTELQLCQRYYAKISSTVSNGAVGSGISRSSTATNVYIKLPVSMRTIPTVSYNTAYINYASDVYRAVDGNSGVQGGTDAINYFPNSSTATIGGNGFAVILAIGSGGYVDFSSEL